MLINRDNDGGCGNVFIILMGGALTDREGSSGSQSQCEGYLTAVWRAG